MKRLVLVLALVAMFVLLGGALVGCDSEVDQDQYTEVDSDIFEEIESVDWEGGSWHTETVDSKGKNGWQNSLTLDSKDQPHIAYCDDGTKSLMYARLDGSNWLIETVDSKSYIHGGFMTINLGPAGCIYIAYVGNGALMLAHWDGSYWQIQTLEKGHLHPSLALDSDNHPNISSYSFTRGLRFARWDGSDWHIETADSSGKGGWFSSLALDPADRPHISYHGINVSTLNYAHWDGSTWHIETVDSDGKLTGYTSIALDHSNYPHISYNDESSRKLKYAHWDGSHWHVENIDDTAGFDNCSSLAIDSTGRPLIAYRSHGNLKFARWDGSIWQIETLDSGGKVGNLTLQLDSSGHPHILYYNGDLMYAVFR